ncbi:DUF3159 domain-containing protein [Streptomyces sp. NPDC001822]|uniref:DUF3159 domain-containing protein n=1 Tax=Streptomyces sp. NPDC001822 TaxID=3364614 RepID=UPI003690B42F
MPQDATEPSTPRRTLLARDACLLVLVSFPTLVWYGFWRFAEVSLVTAAGIALSAGLVATLIAVPLGHVRKLLLATALMAVSATVAAATGRAQDYFLPGIAIDAVYAVVLFGSVVAGRPLIGVALRAGAGRWRFRTPGTARTHAALTLLWAVRFAAEAAVMTVLYLDGNADLLLAARFVLRAPLQVACLALTVLVLARRTGGRSDGEGDGGSRTP